MMNWLPKTPSDGPGLAGLFPLPPDGQYHPWRLALLSFCSCLLLVLPWVLLGFSMRDEGAEMVRQTQVVTSFAQHANVLWLTNLAGGWWQRATDGLGVFGFRLGGLLVAGLTATVCYLVWMRMLGPRLALFCLAAAAMAGKYSGLVGVNYKMFPAMLVFGSAACLLGGLIRAQPRARLGLAALGGALMGFAIMARLPSLAGIFLAVPLLLWAWWFKGLLLGQAWRLVLTYLAACAATVMLGLALLAWLGGWEHYWSFLKVAQASSPSVYSSTHGRELMERLWVTMFIKSLAIGLHTVLFLLLLLAAATVDLARPKRIWILPLALVAVYFYPGAHYLPFLVWPIMLGISRPLAWPSPLVLLICALPVHRYLPYPWQWVALAVLLGGALLPVAWSHLRTTLRLTSVGAAAFLGMQGFHVYHLIPGACMVLSIAICLFCMACRRLPWTGNAFLLSSFGILTGVVVCLGSNQVLVPMYDGLWFILPAALLFLPVALVQALSRWKTPQSPAPSARQLAIALMVALALLGWQNRLQNRKLVPALDQPIATIAQPRLSPILTGLKQAWAVEGLFNTLSGLVEPNQSVLAYDNLPMVHYVTRSRPALDDPWPDLFSPEAIKSGLASLEQSQDLPVCLVRTNRSPQVGSPPTLSKQSQVIDEWALAKGYETIWHNVYYEVLVPR